MPLPSKLMPGVDDAFRSRSRIVKAPAPACRMLAALEALTVISKALASELPELEATTVLRISMRLLEDPLTLNRARPVVDAPRVAAISEAFSAATRAVTAPVAPLALEKLIAMPPLVVAALEVSANSNVSAADAPDDEELKVTVMVSPSAGVVVMSRRPEEA